jgi:hypothetical protein
MSSELEILIEFKKHLINFFDELIDQFPDEGDLVVIRLFLSNQIEIKEVMNIFITNITMNDNLFRNMIKERNEVFFLEHDIFDSLSKQKAGHFKRLWRSGVLDQDDKLVIWKWLDTFVYFADKYTKCKQ